MWPIKYSAILESQVNFDETYTKMSRCENSVFPYYFHSIINFQQGGRKTQMLLKCLFSVYSLRQLHPKESVFSWQMLTKLTKFVRNCQHAILRGGGSIFKLKGPRCGFKLSLVSRLGLMGQKILKISYSRTPENGPICQILLCP